MMASEGMDAPEDIYH